MNTSFCPFEPNYFNQNSNQHQEFKLIRNEKLIKIRHNPYDFFFFFDVGLVPGLRDASFFSSFSKDVQILFFLHWHLIMFGSH